METQTNEQEQGREVIPSIIQRLIHPTAYRELKKLAALEVQYSADLQIMPTSIRQLAEKGAYGNFMGGMINYDEDRKYLQRIRVKLPKIQNRCVQLESYFGIPSKTRIVSTSPDLEFVLANLGVEEFRTEKQQQEIYQGIISFESGQAKFVEKNTI